MAVVQVWPVVSREEAVAWSGVEEVKLIHHRCGYPLYSYIGDDFSWAEGFGECFGVRMPEQSAVLVSYRSAVVGLFPLQVFCCPNCGGVLKLWWDMP